MNADEITVNMLVSAVKNEIVEGDYLHIGGEKYYISDIHSSNGNSVFIGECNGDEVEIRLSVRAHISAKRSNSFTYDV